ncbi:MAG: protein-L-isoaspartate(D-aspartate) O-methyltransferase [Gemmatimonadetes bacterium]|nr:protein-L-isoaspartate(D-aspartate) O-methyltransferase [Gemmatimonadota bacterium]NIR80141.1 protein-L-isoaspartate(D-aspartate) O-methyltransferase [Gemmatimonadota bacterium]NIT88893.1 protein-L-isoaspartate(D-aspartate) O-methyltransferase [Gemmatimonadota bacterium]NIU32696.1 protein-L-isoaspartate(D-aspartate) O-methyltransferase [Gemmatimonadota bacterium]NIU37135.1 protein-L-isoaspartate(D-aspartate) O-methyltransferase [Gemmatimonadota bacterium]
MRDLLAPTTALAALAIAVPLPGPGPATLAAQEAERADERRRMVRTQLAARDITDPRVLEAMEAVPRHEFVPAEFRERAYDDRPLPIGQGQTISQPYIVAFMTQVADVEPEEKVLEVGTGSGYQAAVLAELGARVFTIEIVEELARTAAVRLDRLGYENVEVRHGDGYRGWPEEAPFDAIVVTAAPEEIPDALVEQLAPGGRMVVPVGPRWAAQQLMLVEKSEDGAATARSILPVRFVPMVREPGG